MSEQCKKNQSVTWVLASFVLFAVRKIPCFLFAFFQVRGLSNSMFILKERGLCRKQTVHTLNLKSFLLKSKEGRGGLEVDKFERTYFFNDPKNMNQKRWKIRERKLVEKSCWLLWLVSRVWKFILKSEPDTETVLLLTNKGRDAIWFLKSKENSIGVPSIHGGKAALILNNYIEGTHYWRQLYGYNK